MPFIALASASGDQLFAPSSSYPAGDMPNCICAETIDQDSQKDIIVANEVSGEA